MILLIATVHCTFLLWSFVSHIWHLLWQGKNGISVFLILVAPLFWQPFQFYVIHTIIGHNFNYAFHGLPGMYVKLISMGFSRTPWIPFLNIDVTPALLEFNPSLLKLEEGGCCPI